MASAYPIPCHWHGEPYAVHHPMTVSLGDTAFFVRLKIFEDNHSSKVYFEV